MSTSHELIIAFADIGTVSIRCSQCDTGIALLVSKRPQVPSACPSCGERFDQEFREHVRGFIDMCGFLRDTKHCVQLRVKLPHEDSVR